MITKPKSEHNYRVCGWILGQFIGNILFDFALTKKKHIWNIREKDFKNHQKLPIFDESFIPSLVFLQKWVCEDEKIVRIIFINRPKKKIKEE